MVYVVGQGVPIQIVNSRQNQLGHNVQILVTGSEGFIGSHVVEALLERGHSVKALVNYNFRSDIGWLSAVDGRLYGDSLDVLFGDIRDASRVNELVEGCEAIINLAALIAIPYSYSAPASYVDTNVSGTLNLLEAARTKGVTRFVQMSTSEVYGSAAYVPMDEFHPLNAQSPYAATKVASDQLAMSYHRSFDVPVVIARPFNSFGPRQSLRAVIPTIILQALDGADSIKLGETKSTRDYTYVVDLANGLAEILGSLDGAGSVFNLGSGFELSVGNIVDRIGLILGRELRVELDSARIRPEKSEVTRLYSDSSKASSTFSWNRWDGEPVHRFHENLEKTIEWFQVNKDFYAGDLQTFRY